jgi:cystathionine gamma-synthase
MCLATSDQLRSFFRISFPYADTLKVLQKWGPGCHFFGQGSTTDLASLTSLLSSSRTPEDPHPLLALFCEYPTNPLLRSPDLVAIRKLADEYGFFVVVDETIGNFVNVEVLEWADMVVSSLSKVFSGEVNVMGGRYVSCHPLTRVPSSLSKEIKLMIVRPYSSYSLVLNPSGPYYSLLRDTLSLQYEDNYYPEDAIFMERNSRDFMPRIETINSNAEHLADLIHSYSTLSASPTPLTPGKPIVIKEVYYPKYSTPENYLQCRRPPFLSLSAGVSSSSPTTSTAFPSSSSPLRGRKSVSTAADDANGRFGGLFSLTFTSDASSKAFFDALECAKGPSLGTNFTLACPYTLLAHYQELEWAGECGVNKNLVRVSVGLEDEATLDRWFLDALRKAEEAYEDDSEQRK